MAHQVLSRWIDHPPSYLIVGAGVYARSLAQVVHGDLITDEMLDQGPPSLCSGSYARVFDAFKSLLFVVDAWSIADVLWRFDQFSLWIEKLSGAAEFHEFAAVFVFGRNESDQFERALANGLGLNGFDNTDGTIVWRRSQSLLTLVQELGRIPKTDLQSVRTRRANRPRRQTLVNLKNSIAFENDELVLIASERVAQEFKYDNHALDSFCIPPFHLNGNAWRWWISRVVTEGVTPDTRARAREMLPTLNV